MATCIMAIIRDSWSASLHPNVKLSRFAAKAALKAVSFQSMTGSAAARPGRNQEQQQHKHFLHNTLRVVIELDCATPVHAGCTIGMAQVVTAAVRRRSAGGARPSYW